MKRILIVEDDPAIAEAEKDYLELSGFAVDIAYNGLDGMEKALGEPYDLIVLDLMLPGADGFELCRRIRERKNIPLLMVSARDEDLMKSRGFELGLDDYITKPFSPNELVARVKSRLSRYEELTGKTSAGQILGDSGLAVDLAGRQVYLHGDPVPMTTKEFEILSLLMAHPNRVFSREEIFDRLWLLDSEADSSTITVHIRRLRGKIEFNPSVPKRIMTIWGIGYKYQRQTDRTE